MNGRFSVCAALLGCSPKVSLSEVEVTGGSALQVERALEEIVAFEGWVGAGRIQLSSISFDSLPDRLNGRFNPALGKIQLSDALEPGEVRSALRHELCHALDRGEKLLADSDPLWDEAADAMYHYAELDPDGALPGGSARSRRSEAMAQLCDAGPHVAWAALASCPGDAPLATELMTWLAHVVWVDFELPVVAAWSGQSVTMAAELDTSSILSVHTLVDPGGIGSGIDVTVDYHSNYVDLLTGVPLEEAVNVVEIDYELEGRPPLPDGFFLPTHLSRAWPGGPAVALGTPSDLVGVGRLEGRALWSAVPGSDWSVVEGSCVGTGRAPFGATGDVWWAWFDGNAVRWAPVASAELP